MLLQSRKLLRWLQRSDITFYFDTPRRVVALTIDDAPCAGSTEAILDVLAKHGVRATFFIIGQQAVQHPELMKAIVRAGHELANHDIRDRVSARCGERELREGLARTEGVIQVYQPSGSRWFRPGSGFYTPTILRVARSMRFRLALADAYPHDVRVGHEATVIDCFLRVRVAPGSIVVLHDGRTSLPTAATLDRLLQRLRGEGYAVGTLSDTLAAASGER